MSELEIKYQNPLPDNWEVSSGVGNRVHPTQGTVKPHNGVDIVVPVGTPVTAARDGKVIISKVNKGGLQSGYGNYVVIEHDDGSTTLYAHLSERTVKFDQEVKAGDPIGLSGNTGESTGPHLHFEVNSGRPFGPDEGEVINPLDVTEGTGYTDLSSENKEKLDRFDLNEEDLVETDSGAFIKEGAEATMPDGSTEKVTDLLEMMNDAIASYGKYVEDKITYMINDLFNDTSQTAKDGSYLASNREKLAARIITDLADGKLIDYSACCSVAYISFEWEVLKVA